MLARQSIRRGLAICATIVVVFAGVGGNVLHPRAAGVYQHNQTDLEA